MILSRRDILAQMEMGKIKIDPFYGDQLNPNSYNLTLHEDFCIYRHDSYNSPKDLLDSKKDNPVARGKFDPNGHILVPGELYLCRTVEYTETLDDIVPMIEGRSSFGRLGLLVHVTAGFGDIGYRGTWTLELACIRPIKIYPGQQICQIFYHQASCPDEGYDGRYQGAINPEGSKLWKV